MKLSKKDLHTKADYIIYTGQLNVDDIFKPMKWYHRIIKENKEDDKTWIGLPLHELQPDREKKKKIR